MDEFLIAPCPHPDFKTGVWRVSPRVDEQRDSRRDLIGLSGKAVLEPGERKFYPALESLRWREKQMQVKY